MRRLEKRECSDEETELLRCMLSEGMDASFPSEIRSKRNTKL